MSSEKILKNQIAIVTGAGRGIGRATANALAAEGADVALLARSLPELEAVEEEIKSKYSVKALALKADMTDENDILRAFEMVEGRLGTPQILINNAATFFLSEVEKTSAEDWDHLMSVNLRGPFLCAREAFRRMKKGGVIINISSLAGIRGVQKFSKMTAYVASKAGLVGLTEALAVEGQSKNIRVNAVAPGAVDTLMLKQALPHLKALAKPEDIAGVILSLCDPLRSRVVTGSIVEVFTNVA